MASTVETIILIVAFIVVLREFGELYVEDKKAALAITFMVLFSIIPWAIFGFIYPEKELIRAFVGAASLFIVFGIFKLFKYPKSLWIDEEEGVKS